MAAAGIQTIGGAHTYSLFIYGGLTLLVLVIRGEEIRGTIRKR